MRWPAGGVPLCLGCTDPAHPGAEHYAYSVLSINSPPCPPPPFCCSLTDLGSISDFPASLKQLDASHNQISQWPEPATYWLGGALMSDAVAEERRCYAAGDTNKYIVSVPGRISGLSCAHQVYFRCQITKLRMVLYRIPDRLFG